MKEMQELYNSLTPEQQKSANELKKAFISSIAKTDWETYAAEEARQKQEAIARNEWIVETKISDGGVTVEVSAVIKGSHGHKSWGWHGEHKQVVLATSKVYGKQLPVSKAIIKQAQLEANEICLEKMK